MSEETSEQTAIAQPPAATAPEGASQLRDMFDASSLVPSPGTPGEGQGAGLVDESRPISTPQLETSPPPPQPSPGVPGEGENEFSPGAPKEGDNLVSSTITLPAVAAPSDPTQFIEQKLLEGKVIEALREIFDPEIPVNIYELGLIYEIKIEPDNSVLVKMTLTAPACPVAGTLPGDVEKRVNAIQEVKEAKVELVWDPPWTRERMSESAMLTLGFM